ncbi:uncharacterized protein LOC144878730 [Branchiostoma floridae x Branchiostoma japonicum]
MDMVMYSSDLAEIFEKSGEHKHKEKRHRRTGSYEPAVQEKAATGHHHLQHIQRERAYTDPSHHRGAHGPHHHHRHGPTKDSGTEAASGAGGEGEKGTGAEGAEGAEGGVTSGEKHHHKHHHGLHLPHVHLPHPHLPHMHLPHPHMPQCLQPMDDETEENKERRKVETTLQAEYFPFPF